MNQPDSLDDDALETALRRSRQLEDAPEHLIQRAIGLFEARVAPAAAAPAPTLLRRLAAALSFDSAGSSALAHGLRSGGAGTRQLLYTADGRDIDLRIAPSRGLDSAGWQISGQVLGPDLQGEAELRGEGVATVVPWSELAEFRFDSVGAGRWTLLLRSADWELELPALELTQGA